MERFTKKETDIEGLLVIETHSFEDQRGFFMETYNKKEFEKLGILNEGNKELIYPKWTSGNSNIKYNPANKVLGYFKHFRFSIEVFKTS